MKAARLPMSLNLVCLRSCTVTLYVALVVTHSVLAVAAQQTPFQLMKVEESLNSTTVRHYCIFMAVHCRTAEEVEMHDLGKVVIAYCLGLAEHLM